MRTERSSVGAAFCALCLFSCSSKPSRGAALPPSSFCFLSGASSSDIAEENGERKKAGARKCRRQRHLKAGFTRDTPEIFSEHLQAKRSVSKVVGLSEFATLGLTGIRKSRCARSRHDARIEASSSAASNHTHTHTHAHTHTRPFWSAARCCFMCQHGSPPPPRAPPLAPPPRCTFCHSSDCDSTRSPPRNCPRLLLIYQLACDAGPPFPDPPPGLVIPERKEHPGQPVELRELGWWPPPVHRGAVQPGPRGPREGGGLPDVARCRSRANYRARKR